MHRKQRYREYDSTRGTRQERGYGASWQKLRKLVLHEEPLCRHCLEAGKTVVAEEIDHIDGNVRNVERTNLQPLCKSCHSKKTFREQGGLGNKHKAKVILVCGPPGSGKTTYVREQMAAGDVVVDLDTIIMALTNQPMYHKPPGTVALAIAARDGILRRLEMDADVSRAWVILTAPRAKERRELADRLKAKVIVFEVSEQECVARIARDERRAKYVDEWQAIVAKWWRAYEPSDGDEVKR